MATNKRWKQAQVYEQSFWQHASERIAKDDREQLSWYKWRAERLEKLLKTAFPESPPTFSSAKVLEIGSGPIGVVSFFEAAERYAIDPLCDYYSTRPALVKLRNDNVTYKKGKGEELPFDDASCNLVIIENVIDHVQNADDVMKEIHRALEPDGILYLTVNLHPAWGAFLHSILSNLRIDRGHPHTFTITGIRNFLTRNGFKIIYNEWENYKECRNNDMKSASIVNKVKAISGLSEYLYTCISLKSS